MKIDILNVPRCSNRYPAKTGLIDLESKDYTCIGHVRKLPCYGDWI